jgi:HK97 family phage prohead protease
MPLQTLDRATTVETAVISGVASSPSVDSYGHSVRRGAFDDSIRKRGLRGPSGVKLLQGHQGLPVGKITELRTVGADLRISAELNMELSSVRDLYSVIKHSGGLNFSVGFQLEEFDLDEDAKPGQPWLVVKKGDLFEVSVVTFPACASATMDLRSRSFTPSPWLAKTMAEAGWARFVTETTAKQNALRLKLSEVRRIVSKRQRDEDTLRSWRRERDRGSHWNI